MATTQMKRESPKNSHNTKSVGLYLKTGMCKGGLNPALFCYKNLGPSKSGCIELEELGSDTELEELGSGS